MLEILKEKKGLAQQRQRLAASFSSNTSHTQFIWINLHLFMQPFFLEVKFQSGLGIKVLRLKLVFKNLILFCVMSGSGLRVDRDCCLHCILFSTNPQRLLCWLQKCEPSEWKIFYAYNLLNWGNCSFIRHYKKSGSRQYL